MSDDGGYKSLRQATAAALRMHGRELLGAPHRFVGVVSDYIDTESLEMGLLYVGCDERFLSFFAAAAQAPTAEGLHASALQAASYLENEYVIRADVAESACASIAQGIGDVLGVSTTEVWGSADKGAQEPGAESVIISGSTQGSPVVDARPSGQGQDLVDPRASATYAGNAYAHERRQGFAQWQDPYQGQQLYQNQTTRQILRPAAAQQYATGPQPVAAPPTAKKRHVWPVILLLVAVAASVVALVVVRVAEPSRSTSGSTDDVSWELRTYDLDGKAVEVALLHNNAESNVSVEASFSLRGDDAAAIEGELVLPSGGDGILLQSAGHKVDSVEPAAVELDVSTTTEEPASESFTWEIEERDGEDLSYIITNHASEALDPGNTVLLYDDCLVWYAAQEEADGQDNVYTPGKTRWHDSGEHTSQDLSLYLGGVKVEEE